LDKQLLAFGPDQFFGVKANDRMAGNETLFTKGFQHKTVIKTLLDLLEQVKKIAG
jgi:hypothetical protein